MSFWSTSEGEIQQPTDGNFDAGGGKIIPLPEGAQVMACIDEAKWDKTDKGDRFISLRWTVLKPEDFQNRKIFQKLWVLDDDPSAKDPAKKRDKAKRMLAAIDFNAGGKLLAKGEAPSDESMTVHLTNKPMVIKTMVWEQKDRETGAMIYGNWIGAVAPKGSETTSADDIKKAQKPYEDAIAAAPRGGSGGGSGGGRSGNVDDEIPF